MFKHTLVALTSLLAASAGLAQPRIVSLGSNAVGNAVLDGGNIVAGSVGPGAARWTISGSGVTILSLPESRYAVDISSDGQWITGSIANTGGLGGFPIDANLAARWNETTGWSPLPLIAPDASLGVTGPGVSGGEISNPFAISADGRFIVGQGYIAPDEVYQFRGWAWDAQGGPSRVLPTAFNPDSNRFRDGRALDVSADGTVIVGGESPNTGEGRVIVWRWNAGTSSYDATYLPDGVDDRGNPLTRGVDSFYINDAGTIITGTSFEWDKTLGFPVGPYLARWTWDADAAQWNRQLLDDNLTTPATWWTQPDWCPLPPTLIPTGMSDDGNTIVGIVTYSVCGSFVRGGFIWTAGDNEIADLYDFLVQQGTPGIEAFGPTEPGFAPRLGWANDVSPDGLSLTGYGGPFSGFGPGWVVNLSGGDCVNPFITASPDDVLLSRCNFFIMNAGAGGSGPLSFQWMKDNAVLLDGTTPGGSIVTGATSSQLRIANVTPDDAGNYHCVVTGVCGAPVATAAASASVDPSVTPAANDTCATAAAVNEGTFDFSPCGAFFDDALGTVCAETSSADVWFAYTPTFTGTARIETCGANYDTVLSVHSACDGVELNCNDDRLDGPLNSCSFFGSRLALPVTEGETVLVRVANLGFLFEFSMGQLSIGEAPAPAANDLCQNATPAVVGANPFSTDEASADGTASCGFATSGRDVWFTFTAPADGSLSLTTCGDIFWDTVLTVFDTCFGNELACNNDTQSKFCYSQSTIENLAVQSGVTYVIRIGTNYDGDGGGSGVLTLDFSTGCTADFNTDGLVNSQDFFDFLTAFFAAAPNADFNADMVINSQDFFDFLTAFFAGC